MARWRERRSRIEAPGWYRVFDPAMWDEPDEHERQKMDGNLGYPWPAELHRMHAERRWGEAQYAYRRAHPAFGHQEFEDLMTRVRGHRQPES